MARGPSLCLIASLALGCASAGAPRPTPEPAVSVPDAPPSAPLGSEADGPSTGQVQATVLDAREGGEALGTKLSVEPLERCHRPHRPVGWVMLRPRARGEPPELDFEIVEHAGVAPEVARCVQSALRQTSSEGISHQADNLLVYVRLR